MDAKHRHSAVWETDEDFVAGRILRDVKNRRNAFEFNQLADATMLEQAKNTTGTRQYRYDPTWL